MGVRWDFSLVAFRLCLCDVGKEAFERNTVFQLHLFVQAQEI